jgi:hypothetical protein
LAKLDAKAKEEEVQLWQSTTAAVLSFIDEVCQANVKTLRDHHLKQRAYTLKPPSRFASDSRYLIPRGAVA